MPTGYFKNGEKIIPPNRSGIPSWNKGRHLSDKHKKSLSLSHIGKCSGNGFKKGNIPWNKNKPFLQIRGEKHFAWKGGYAKKDYPFNWTETFKRSIRERDGYLCGLCGGLGLDVHHIDYDKKNCDPQNLITLCVSCHRKTNFNRNYWLNYLKRI